MHDLVAESTAVILAAQAPSGAYPACPTYPTYRYCWFRDGAFIAHAMDQWGEHASARRFYEWAARMVVARVAAVERCVAAAARGERPAPDDLLHTRYRLDGGPGEDEWPNFQLDGFGTLLWGLHEHQALRADPAPAAWTTACRLLVRYLAALWQQPNADCWEEFEDHLAISTLAAVHAGLHAAASALGAQDDDGALAAVAAGSVAAYVRVRGTRDGHLIKQVDGDDVVDASLLWACVPFGVHGLLAPTDPLMRATVARIEADLIGASGGVHRYRADTFYGGGEWILLTALLGEYYAASGDHDGARRCLAFVEARADEAGHLPEQISMAPLHPAYVDEWVERWGPVARPLLWSHAGYLSLAACLRPWTDR